MRTSLSVEQLFRQASGECQGEYPKCFYANEVGSAFEKGTDKKKEEAKEALLKLLASPDREIAAISFCYLYPSVDESIKRLIKEFQDDPKNERTLSLAATMS